VSAPGDGRPARLLLVGMMGAGKSTVGQLLADRLGWGYVDSDEDVVRRTGRTVAEIFATDGEPAFRTEESVALRDGLTQRGPVVVSVAGGAVLDPSNRALLADAGTVVWLRARPDTLAARVGDGHDRPLLGDDPLAALERLAAAREPLYAGLADVTVDVDDRTPAEVADQVLREAGLS